MKFNTPSLAPSRFFSDKELRDIAACIKEMEGVGVIVKAFYKVEPGEEEKGYFMGLARLWRVVRTITQLAFMEKLKNGTLTLVDKDGIEYGVVEMLRPQIPINTLWKTVPEVEDDIGG